MSAETTSMLVTFVPLIGMVVLLYFFMIRPQKKKEKQAADMRNSIEVGDGITTIGGIVGRVASIKEDTFVLETGSDRVKMRFKRWAIQDVEKLSLDTPNQWLFSLHRGSHIFRGADYFCDKLQHGYGRAE